MTTYRLVVPRTHRSGPGTRSHLKPVRGKRTLCNVENNARGVDPLGFATTPGDLAHCEREIDRVHTCRKLCGNCRDIARRDAS